MDPLHRGSWRNGILGVQSLFSANFNSRWRAYTDSDTLFRFELPIIGQLASRWTDNE